MAAFDRRLDVHRGAATRNADQAALRKAQTRQLLLQMPNSSLLSIVIALCLFLSLRREAPAGELIAWLATVISFNLWRRRRVAMLIADDAKLRAVSVVAWRTIATATVAAALFSLPSWLWWGMVGFEGKAVICILITGMMSGAAVSLSEVPVAAFLYIAILGAVTMVNYHAMGLNVLVAMSASYKIGDASVVIGASIGVACGPVDGGDDQALIRSADLALYGA